MRNKILSRLILVMAICSSILMFFTYNLLEETYYNKEAEYLKITMAQLTAVLDNSKNKREQAIQLFLDDYLNRLNYIKVSLEKIEKDRVFDSIDTLLEAADVKYYYYVDKNGIVQNSNDLEAIGVNFYEEEILLEYIPLIEGREESDYHLKLNGKSITRGEVNSYLGIGLEGGGMLSIEIDHSAINKYIETSSIEYAISSIPSKENEIIFAINPTNDELIAITKNNKQKVEIEDRVETLKKAMDGPITIIGNGNEVILYAKEYDNIILGIGTRLNVVMKPLQGMFMRGLIIILILCVVICATTFLSIKNIVLDDLGLIQSKIIDFCNGKKIKFDKKKTKEMTEFASHLNDVIAIIKSRESSISNIVSYIGTSYAAYEYYPKINQLFYSENIPIMFGLTDEECKQTIFGMVNNLSDDLKKLSEIVEYTAKSGRIFKIQRTFHNDAYYGFIEDITEIRERENLLQEQLVKEKEASNLDPLTGLYNRKMIENYFDYMAKNNKELSGILMLIDLDNFKKVNDKKGHMEGDKVLKQVAEIINKSFRDWDIKVRLGGDEFIVYMQNSIPMNILERKIESFISNVRMELKQYYDENHLSVSVGAVLCDKDCDSYEKIYQMADGAMYVAKNSGKDGYYINKEGNTCNLTSCINCKGKCERRRALFGE